jgi:hypothetical protein
MPGAIKARPTVNQPLSIAKVRASASAAAEPAACSAAAADTTQAGLHEQDAQVTIPVPRYLA